MGDRKRRAPPIVCHSLAPVQRHHQLRRQPWPWRPLRIHYCSVESHAPLSATTLLDIALYAPIDFTAQRMILPQRFTASNVHSNMNRTRNTIKKTTRLMLSFLKPHDTCRKPSYDNDSQNHNTQKVHFSTISPSICVIASIANTASVHPTQHKPVIHNVHLRLQTNMHNAHYAWLIERHYPWQTRKPSSP